MTEEMKAYTPQQFVSLEAYAAEKLVFGDNLVCPLMAIWQDYKQFCKTWGFDQVTAVDLMFWLTTTNNVYISLPKGRGRRKRFASGVGVRPKGLVT